MRLQLSDYFRASRTAVSWIWTFGEIGIEIFKIEKSKHKELKLEEN